MIRISRITKAAAVVAIFGLGIFVGGIASQGQTTQGQTTMDIPTKHKGLSVAVLGMVGAESIEKQIGLSGYDLRLREVVIEPGGAIARHSHAKRPGVVQTISGTFTEGRAAGAGMAPIITEYPAGKKQALLETWDTEHWGWNTGQEPATILVCDLAPPS
jgi:hypothetical protein